MSARIPGNSVEWAEGLAVEALTFLAQDHERLERFLTLTGLSPAQLRKAASDPGFFPAILDYCLSHEALVVAFASWSGQAPNALATARERLAPLWTDESP